MTYTIEQRVYRLKQREKGAGEVIVTWDWTTLELVTTSVQASRWINLVDFPGDVRRGIDNMDFREPGGT